MSKKLTVDDFIIRARLIHGDEFDYIDSRYIGYDKPITIRCRKHNKIFSQLASNHLHGSKCSECKSDSLKLAFSYTTKEFISKAIEAHGDKYEYLMSKYVNSTLPVTILCRMCGVLFDQLPLDHINGHGCNKCGGTMKLTYIEFVDRAIEIHGDKFDYSDFNYINHKTKGDIKCKHCNTIFHQSPNSHLSGIGCSNCAGNMPVTTKEFVSRSVEIHGDKFDYIGVNYVGMNVKVRIKCNKCMKTFDQLPKNHIYNKQGCPNCGLLISKSECDFLDYLSILNDKSHRQVKIIGKKACDGYDIKNNTIYEFLGDYYHGNLNVYTSDFKNTLLNKTAQELYNYLGNRINHGLVLRDKLVIWNERQAPRSGLGDLYPAIPNNAKNSLRFPIVLTKFGITTQIL